MNKNIIKYKNYKINIIVYIYIRAIKQYNISITIVSIV